MEPIIYKKTVDIYLCNFWEFMYEVCFWSLGQVVLHLIQTFTWIIARQTDKAQNTNEPGRGLKKYIWLLINWVFVYLIATLC